MRERASHLVIRIALALVFGASLARASEIELTPFVGYRWGGEVESERSADLESGIEAGLSFAWRVRPDAWFEVLWSHEESEFDLAPFTNPGGAFGFDVGYVHFGSTYRPARPAGRAQPFVGFSAGLTYFRPEASGFENQEGVSLGIAGGATFPLGNRVGLRLSSRGYFTFSEARFSGTCGSEACSFELSGEGMPQIDLTLGLVFRPGSAAGGP
jgi:hypothetical protein